MQQLSFSPPHKVTTPFPLGRQVFNKTFSQEKCSKPGLRSQTYTLHFGFIRIGAMRARPEVTPTPKPERFPCHQKTEDSNKSIPSKDSKTE